MKIGAIFNGENEHALSESAGRKRHRELGEILTLFYFWQFGEEKQNGKNTRCNTKIHPQK